MVGRVGIVVGVIEIRKCDAVTMFVGVATHEGTGVVGVVVWGALTSASSGKVQVRHCWVPCEADWVSLIWLQ